MSFTIKRSQTDSLCNTCSNGVQIRGMRLGEEKTLCHALPDSHAQITYPIEFCSSYQRRNTQNIHEMNRIGWVIEIKKGQFAGFHDPEAVKKKGLAKETWELTD
jgi:hypothetical protein